MPVDLSYHLASRPKWVNDLRAKPLLLKVKMALFIQEIKSFEKICPGIYGTIQPVGYCMIGKK